MYQKCQLESFIFSFSISGNSDVQKRSNTVLMCSCVSRSTGVEKHGPNRIPEPARNPKGKLIFVNFFFEIVLSCGAEILDFLHFLETRNPTSNTRTRSETDGMTTEPYPN